MRAHATFEINSWNETPADQIPGGHVMSRATAKKTFRGDLEGTSVADLLLSKGPDGSAAYVAMERIEAQLGERSGIFVLMHAATADGKGQHGGFTTPDGPAGEDRHRRARVYSNPQLHQEAAQGAAQEFRAAPVSGASSDAKTSQSSRSSSSQS